MTFVVPGTPHAKQRARTMRSGYSFTPKETVHAETFIRLMAAPHFQKPIAGPIVIDVMAVFQPPASWSGAKVRRMLGTPHCQRPDFDNLQKTVADALNGIAYQDDSQISDARVRKVWGPVAKTVITIGAAG